MNRVNMSAVIEEAAARRKSITACPTSARSSASRSGRSCSGRPSRSPAPREDLEPDKFAAAARDFVNYLRDRDDSNGAQLRQVLTELGRGRNFDAALFGSILGVGWSDVAAVLTVAAGVGLVVFFGYRRLLFTTFDPDVAEASGVNTARVDAVLMLALAASILVTMQVLGVTLIAATLVIPPTIARMLTSSFSRMLWSSTLLGAVTGFLGRVAS